MKMHSALLAAAAIGASAVTVGLAVAPAQAAPLFVQDVVVTGRSSDLPQAIVRYADLNLKSGAGMARLDRRIRRAALMLCGRAITLDLTMKPIIHECHSTVHASAEPQVKALLAALDNGERLALGDVGALTLSAK